MPMPATVDEAEAPAAEPPLPEDEAVATMPAEPVKTPRGAMVLTCLLIVFSSAAIFHKLPWIEHILYTIYYKVGFSAQSSEDLPF